MNNEEFDELLKQFFTEPEFESQNVGRYWNEYLSLIDEFFTEPEIENRHAGWVSIDNLLMIHLTLIGPMSGIFTTGKCDYTYKDDERFPGVRNPNTFLAWVNTYYLEYDQLVALYKPRTPTHRRDHDKMKAYSQIIARTLKLAREILNETESDNE